MLRAFLFASSVSSRRWTASTWRGVAQPAEFVRTRGDEQLAGALLVKAFVRLRVHRPPSHADVRGERDVVFTQIRPVIVVFDTRHALGRLARAV